MKEKKKWKPFENGNTREKYTLKITCVTASRGTSQSSGHRRNVLGSPTSVLWDPSSGKWKESVLQSESTPILGQNILSLMSSEVNLDTFSARKTLKIPGRSQR
jgi:hypothetical protein